MNENLNADNSWLNENESYLKNKKRRRKMTIIFVAALWLIGIAVFFYLKNNDELAYMYGIDSYYDALNKGSSYCRDMMKQELTDDAAEGLSSKGISGYSQWIDILQQLDARIMEDKYGEGFKVAYRIEKTEPLTEKELDDYRKNIAIKGDYDKAYRLTMKEHFKGPKGEGFEKQNIIVARKNGERWVFQEERQVELGNDIRFLYTVDAHYDRINSISADPSSLDSYDFPENTALMYAEETGALAEEFGEGFQVTFSLDSISTMSPEELAYVAEYAGIDEDDFIKGYKAEVVEHFTSDKGENTSKNTMLVPFEDEENFLVYDKRYVDMYE
ncbi:hypothetical protein [Ruminococcus sp.]|uniref:hypothetical protein n=1 Tax=Ruminococcus sp. TaxID=41978 RepID=UPI0025EAC75E|nr:hypothetical protein [Ruminococcus sp.]MBQ8966832.1 hypothetical protein [Ruminococcus sp.]